MTTTAHADEHAARNSSDGSSDASAGQSSTATPSAPAGDDRLAKELQRAVATVARAVHDAHQTADGLAASTDRTRVGALPPDVSTQQVVDTLGAPLDATLAGAAGRGSGAVGAAAHQLQPSAIASNSSAAHHPAPEAVAAPRASQASLRSSHASSASARAGAVLARTHDATHQRTPITSKTHFASGSDNAPGPLGDIGAVGSSGSAASAPEHPAGSAAPIAIPTLALARAGHVRTDRDPSLTLTGPSYRPSFSPD